jgi:hypothetical protein
VCKCEQFLSFLNPTYEHTITGDLAIIKQMFLQSIMQMGAKFRLSNHLKPSNVLSGLHNDLDLFIVPGAKKRKLIKIVFRIGKTYLLIGLEIRYIIMQIIVIIRQFSIMLRKN